MQYTKQYKGFTIAISTNMLKNGYCYFGEKNIDKEILYSINSGLKNMDTLERRLMWIFGLLKRKGIKLDFIEMNGLTYKGTTITEIGGKND